MYRNQLLSAAEKNAVKTGGQNLCPMIVFHLNWASYHSHMIKRTEFCTKETALLVKGLFLDQVGLNSTNTKKKINS